ncbi:MAG: ABC transporter permease [Terriglobales bacterium]
MKILTVIQRELLIRVRTKGFVIFTFGIPVLAAAFMFLEYKIIAAGQNVTSTVAVVDLSQQVMPGLQQAPSKAAQEDENRATFHFQPVAATEATLPQTESQLRAEVLAKKLDGYLVIPADVLTSRVAQYHASNTAAISVAYDLQTRLRDAVNTAALEASGIPAAKTQGLLGGFDLHQIKVSATGEHKDSGQSFYFAIGLVMVLYLLLLLYGVVVMRAVTEEKTSRVSEVLLASVDPFSLMMGKILGVVTTALCQIIVWGVCLALFAVYGVAMAQAAGLNWKQYLPHSGAALLVWVVLFFLAGFLLYSSIYAAIGAMVSSDQEAQQTQMPLTMVLAISIYLAFMVMMNPTSLLSTVLSLVPFFAPVLMVARLAVSTPPLWQVLLSLALCVATFLGCTQLTARIYRVGILMTGKRPSLPELMRWLKYT